MPLESVIALVITKAREQNVPVKIKQASERSGPHSCIAFWTNEAVASGEIVACASPAKDFPCMNVEWRFSLRDQKQLLLKSCFLVLY